MKLIVLQRVFPVYREAVFLELYEQARQHGHQIEIWASPATGSFAKRENDGRYFPWVSRLPVIGSGYGLFRLEWQRLPWSGILNCDVMIVPDNMRVLSNVVALLLRRLAGRCVLTWGHGSNFQPDDASRQLAHVRYALLRLAHGHLVYTHACVAPLLNAGFERSKIAITENAIDTSAAIGLHPEHPDVLSFRALYGLGSDPCVVFLGSWYPRKRPEWIPRIGEALRERVPQARVLVIGGGESIDSLRSQAAPWLTVLGPLQGYRKYVALASSRCLLVTNVAGLNVLDAMAVGLPVVLSRSSDHSPEVTYVRDNLNGLIVSDDVGHLARAGAHLCIDGELHARLSDGAKHTAAGLTVRKMVGNLLNHALSFLDKLNRR